MSEIKVKAYGLIEFTKKQYLITQTIVFIILLALLYISLQFDLSGAEDLLLRYASIGIAIIIILEILETAYMMIKFKKAESKTSGD